jgi:hypothetical protein
MADKTYYMDPDQSTIDVYITVTDELRPKLAAIGITEVGFCTEKADGKYPELAKYKHMIDVCYMNEQLDKFEALMKAEGYIADEDGWTGYEHLK